MSADNILNVIMPIEQTKQDEKTGGEIARIPVRLYEFQYLAAKRKL